MKVLLAILSGVAATGVGYLAGVFTTIFLLIPQPEPIQVPPQNASETTLGETARIVSTDRNDLERMPVRPIPRLSIEAQADTEPREAELFYAEENLDTATTGSILDAAPVEPAESELAFNMNGAHVRWCSEQYRSYRPEDNSYTPYSGGSRQCESPFSASAAEFEEEEEANFVQASIDTREEWAGGHLSSQHIQSCFDRYRSYRPEDNSYQPYDGGPRRQCQ